MVSAIVGKVRRHFRKPKSVKRRKPLATVPPLRGDQFVFICGLHRSGTSVLHRILRAHPEISGFSGTGVPEDEGQHLQTVFQPARTYGGPGRFAFDPRSRMDESSVRDADTERATLLREWGAYYDLDKRIFLEKSPPSVIRSRYFQRLFPGAAFIFLVRHPIPVSLATQKWSRTTWLELLLHWQMAHLLMLRDIPYIQRSIVIRYEDLVAHPEQSLQSLADFLGTSAFPAEEPLRDANDRYFARWGKAETEIELGVLNDIVPADHWVLRHFGYRLSAPYATPMDKIRGEALSANPF